MYPYTVPLPNSTRYEREAYKKRIPCVNAAFDRLLARFPFDAVEQHMRTIRWKWSRDESDGVRVRSRRYHPTVEDLRREARQLFKDLVRDDRAVCGSCGGFTIQVTPYYVLIGFGKSFPRRTIKGPIWVDTEFVID